VFSEPTVSKVSVMRFTREDALQIQSGLRWYVIQTKPKKEKAVGRRLVDLGLEVFLPWLKARRRIGAKFQWILAPLFPGYLFCCLDLVLSGKAARYSPGVKDFLKFGNEITEVGMDVVETLRQRCPEGIVRIEPRTINRGELVKITEGPFSGLEAVFEQTMKGSERVAVLLEILGRQTRLVLPSAIIAKA
jgi:transcriptional antiterminator RfaH